MAGLIFLLVCAAIIGFVSAGWLGLTIGVAVVLLAAKLIAGSAVQAGTAWQVPTNAVRLPTGGEFEVRGESHYQDALERICGGRNRDGAEHRCLAALIPEPTNAFDPNAIRVEIEGQLVGYLSRAAAEAYRPVAQRLADSNRVGLAEAMIVGGWERGSDRGHFGVCLYMPSPGALMRAVG